MSGIEYDWERFAEAWRNSGCVNSGQVGPKMEPSHEHLLCVEFTELHPYAADFLFSKLSDTDPYLAAYAFKCLTRVSDDLQMDDIPQSILQRSDSIQTLWGCVVRTTTLGSFIRGYWGFEDPEPEPPAPPPRYLP
ncbi:hypothetical protein DES53_101273 [Roseimicrobium gellanilyticum]|uniref:Uncharacterized protein n=1 Tax=Roseimicrobium gellanilyticum TaxID=748857 RepID=A0A366HT68_9BACT|nr:hypothetical protein [Roseimicrobium gellanilyticum]RBP47476.1 hypothetical protein DES53_101273 [Roseimicrobium gellanilyticum]